MRFKNKVVIITWASSWIWRITALYFWKEWASVVVNYLNSEDKSKKVVDSIEKLWWKAISIRWDISNEEDVKNLVSKTIEKFWKIDILINNAWISNSIPILERTSENWKKTFDVNLLWTFLCSKYSIIEMLKTWWWKIVNLSSINWTKHFYPEQIDYDITKSWIITLTKELAKEFWPNIYVNAVAPWNIDNYDENEPTWDPTEEENNKIYLKRYWKIQEIAKAILFLSSEESSYVNWTTIFLDWGCD
jgi:NAD(P)-dependent dehydrogenase (short-subunit alcohol dehydrogenase family)